MEKIFVTLWIISIVIKDQPDWNLHASASYYDTYDQAEQIAYEFEASGENDWRVELLDNSGNLFEEWGPLPR